MTRGRDPTQFTRESAERIARVVRAAELGAFSARPVAFERIDPPAKSKIFRVAYYTGDWSIGGLKIVTFKNVTNTPNTATVMNLFLPIQAATGATARDCAIAKEGTNWYLLQSQAESAAVIVDASLNTSTLVFTRRAGISYGSASSATISVSTCSTATTS